MSASDNPQSAEAAHALTTMHVRQAIDGDRDSVSWLVQRLAPVLTSYADYRLGAALRAHSDPEDLVNEAWLVTLPKLPEIIARGGRYTPVLVRYLSSVMLHRIQKIAHRHLRDPTGAVAAPADEDPPALQPGVPTAAIHRELRDQVREGLAELADEDREVLLLRGVEGQPVKHVGVLLGIQPDAVSKRYGRALQRLRKQLPNSVFEEFDDA